MNQTQEEHRQELSRDLETTKGRVTSCEYMLEKARARDAQLEGQIAVLRMQLDKASQDIEEAQHLGAAGGVLVIAVIAIFGLTAVGIFGALFAVSKMTFTAMT